MEKQKFIDLVVKNHSSKQWINGTETIDGVTIGVKAYGKWVQRLQRLDTGTYTTFEAVTVKEFREKMAAELEKIMTNEGAAK